MTEEKLNDNNIWSYIKNVANRWFITASGGMAFGLFASLIAGTIVNQIGKWIGDGSIGLAFQTVGFASQILMGAGIGAGVAHSLKAEKLVLFSAVCAGFIGAQCIAIINSINANEMFSIFLRSPGDPVSAFLVSLIAVELGQFLKGRTRLDIVVLPISAILISCLMAFTICPPIVKAFTAFGNWIMLTTETNPIWMGLVISVSIGLFLTMPTSSAAICVACGIGGLAGGAAVVGGASHMICFAVMSWRENRISGLIAQGIGTSMLQIPNIFKNPRLLIPPVLASAVGGIFASAVFQIHCDRTGSGMGTSGLVGVFTTVSTSLDNGINTGTLIFAVILLFFVIPAIFGVMGRLILGKINWIKDGDLKLEL
ncbi:MAG: PTS sugar transporter subunit IIC [Treponema sp.]|nr:PTS sugar transporter subunit IIC [Treponema sp.]